jgi:5'-AMP-activated protein kinase, regulatory gamma subunit
MPSVIQLSSFPGLIWSQEEEKKGGRAGRLLGIITLSDILRYVIGHAAIAEMKESGS